MTTRGVEIKLSFERYDCTPSYTEWCAFESKLLGHGGTADDHGWSYADVFQGVDDGGALGNALPAAPANADERTAVRLRRKRLKASHSYLIVHLSNRFWVDKLSTPPLLGDGEQSFNELRNHCRVTPDVVDTQDLQQEWRTVTIPKDVGSHENTILDLSNLLDAKNALIPAAQQFSDEDTAERILRCVAAASRLFAESATRELNAIEGIPGQPGVRQFQGPAPAGGGARPRDRAGMVAYYHSQWRAAYRSGAITKVAATKLRPSGSSHAVDRGMAILHQFAESNPDSTTWDQNITPPPRTMRPGESLRAACEAGFQLQRGTCTTSDFAEATDNDLQAAVDAAENGLESEVGFSVETCYDADDVTSIELLCNNCRGPGHMSRSCPSPKKYRSFAYVAELNLRALQRVETRARERNGPVNGNRPLPRGQKPPFRRGIPKKFQDAHPFRRLGAYNRPATQSVRIADEEAGTGSGDPVMPTPSSPGASEFTRSAVLARDGLPPGLQMPLHLLVPSEPSDEDGELSDEHKNTTEQGRQGLEVEVRTTSPPAVVPRDAMHPQDAPRRRAAQAARVAVVGLSLAALYEVGETLTEGARSCVAYMQQTVHLAGAVLTGIPVAVIVILLLAGMVRSEDVQETTMERACEITKWTPDGWSTEAGGLVSPAKRHEVSFCVDSGATCVCIPAEERWLLSDIGDPSPNIKLVVANGAPLEVECVGTVNGPGGGPRLMVEGRRYCEDDKSWGPTERLAPFLSRVLAVKGLAPNTRLAGVQPLKTDGIFSYFNEDNRARSENCVQLPSGHYVHFRSARECNIVFEVETRGMKVGTQDGSHEPQKNTTVTTTTASRTALSTHAGLMHASSDRIRTSNVVVHGINTNRLDIGITECRGCQRSRPAPSFLSTSAPSAGKVQRSVPSRNSTRIPSASNYTFFGQRMDTDICTNLPASWPHGFVAMINFCDRHTAEWFVYFMSGCSADEVDGCMGELETRVRTRLREGKIWNWHIDNDLALIRASRQEAAKDLIVAVSRRIPHLSNSNPVAERLWRTLEETIRRTTAFAGDAPLCLWPWIVNQAEQVSYFLSTRAHNPATSPFRFAYPHAPPADLSWAEPLFCDVVVHLPKPDVDGKLAYTSTVGCYLGHDFRRNAQIVYCPEQQRIGHFVVDTWIRNKFEKCKSIGRDTPVQYREPDDLRYSQFSQVPAVISVRAHCVGEKLAANAETQSANRIEADVASLSALPEVDVLRECARKYRDEQGNQNEQPDDGVSFETVIVGSEEAKAVVKENSTLQKIDSVTAARRSKHWQLIKEAMESEIQGKVANEFASPVPYTGQRLMKTKWVILIHLAADGRVVKVKARLVACGYSQLQGIDYGNTSAPTLPGTCYRLFTCICAIEDLDTDHIDAVKAFTQSLLDRVLFCAMPEGFEIPGYVLQLHKALEGIKQGAHLWFQKNKWAWERCGCKADPAEPNLYIHAGIQMIIAVFADDVAAGFHAKRTSEYLALRAEYAKLIRIDSPSPESIVPLTDFVGTEWHRDRKQRTIKVTQRKYLYKLSQRYRGKFTLNDMPYKATKGGRDAIESIGVDDSSDAKACDKATYLEVLGSIGWPACMTRPELAYIYSKLGGVSMAPSQRHLDYAMHVIGYLANTPDVGPTYGGRLHIPPGVTNTPPRFFENSGLYGVSDSSFGRSARPHGGHVVMRGNAAILWSSKKFKTVVPDSTAEAETLEGSRATKALMFVKNVLMGIERPAVGAIALFCDNQAMFALVQSNVVSQRTRHFERAATLVRWASLRLLVQPHLVSTDYMIADIFTKAVEQDVFQRFRDLLLNVDRDTAILGKVSKLLSKWV